MNILIVGYGSIGKRHHAILRQMLPNATFSVCDVQGGFVKIDEIRDILYDLAVITTPTSNHIDAVLNINSNSFFIEKPLDSDFKKIEDNISYFKDKKTMVVCNISFSKHCEQIKKYINQSTIVNVRYLTYLPLWRENYKDLYCCHKGQGGGIFNDVYPHEFTYITNFIGLPNKIKINKYRLSNITKDTDDYTKATFEYDNNIVNFEFSYLSKYKIRTCEMFLDDGERELVDFSGAEKLKDQHTVSDIDETYVRQWEYFLKTDKPLNSCEDAYNLLKLMNKDADKIVLRADIY